MLFASPVGEKLQRVAQEALDVISTEPAPFERILARHVLAQHLALHSEFSAALKLHEASDADAGDDYELRALVAYARATVYNRKYDLEAARALLAPYANGELEERSIEIAARVRTLYAGVLDSLGNAAASEREFSAAIALRERIGHPRGLAIVYYNFAESCARRDEDDVALEFFLRALELERQLQDSASIAQSACHIAVIMARQHNRIEAERYSQIALDEARRSGKPLIIAQVLANQAAIHEALGNKEDLEKALVLTLDYIQGSEAEAIRGPTLANLGALYSSQGKCAEAERLFLEALDISIRHGHRYQEGYIRLCLGKCWIRTHRLPEAIESLTLAAQILQSVKAHVYTLEALQALAQAHSAAGSTAANFKALAEWLSLYAKEHHEEMEQRVQHLEGMRLKERKEREEEIFKLRNVELQQALEELKNANAELRELASEKDEFMAMAAHDLRNPLSDARGMLKMIVSNYDNLEKSDVLSLCSDVLSLTVRMANTVHSFLEVSRTDKRQSGLLIQPMNCNLVVNRAVERHARRGVEKSISVTAAPTTDEVWATADASVAEAIIDNLVSNALKYAPSGAQIEIGTAQQPAGPVVFVSDNGPGVDPSQEHLLFTKYAYLGGKPTGGEESLGLGLYLAQRMAARMGANISYAPREGGGSVFTLRMMKRL